MVLALLKSPPIEKVCAFRCTPRDCGELGLYILSEDTVAVPVPFTKDELPTDDLLVSTMVMARLWAAGPRRLSGCGL